MQEYQPKMLSVLRIVVGWMFMAHGGQKLLNWPIPMPGTLQVFSQAWIGGWIELVGGVLIFLGLFTRPFAFLLSGTMAVAYWQFHSLPALGPRPAMYGLPATEAQPLHSVLIPIMNNGELAVLYSFVFLYLVFAGGGPMSLDALLQKKRKD